MRESSTEAGAMADQARVRVSKADLKTRTMRFALSIIDLCRSLPRGGPCSVIAKQLLRCGTSVGANYRSACQARSKVDFIAKMGIVAEEADESQYWMELLAEGRLCAPGLVAPLLAEARELTAIAVSSINTARARQGTFPNSKSQIPNEVIS